MHQILDTITFTNSAGPYNLEQGSAAFTPISPQALVISVDGVIQASRFLYDFSCHDYFWRLNGVNFNQRFHRA